MPYPVRLLPSLRARVWGRRSLAPFFPDSPDPVGEVWFAGDGDLPLLVKFIFTSERLSVQVHPADGEDGARGKNEMWHILDADPDAKVALGFHEPLSSGRLAETCRSGEIENLVRWIPVRAGETYFTPAHTVHAIGAGIVLCEIQQNSDLTYRLWDYGRNRELHVAKALPLADRSRHPGATTPVPLGEGWEELGRCRHFVTERMLLKPGARFNPEPQTCQMWICLEGEGAIGGTPCAKGEVWLLPDTGGQPEITGPALFLRTYVP
jgi:mannose-6-phosphate isomerase